MTVKKFSAKQLRFIDEYTRCFNASRAARYAGYSQHSARSQGSRLLTDVDIQAEIKRLSDAILELKQTNRILTWLGGLMGGATVLWLLGNLLGLIK